MAPTRSRRGASWGLAAAAALGLIAALLYFFLPDDGVDGTLGAGVTIASTAIMLLAAAALALGYARGWVRGLLLFLILLDILGTGFCAYMLEALWLGLAMTLALVAWLFDVFVSGRPRASLSLEAAS
jgi:hypothetical protein